LHPKFDRRFFATNGSRGSSVCGCVPACLERLCPQQREGMPICSRCHEGHPGLWLAPVRLTQSSAPTGEALTRGISAIGDIIAS
jgi:hypothetical protein